MSLDARRRERLDAMGVVAWRLRAAGSSGATGPAQVATATATRSPGSAAGPESGSPPVHRAPPPAVVDPELEALRAQVAPCTRCALHESRTQTVFGVGAANARLMVVGEAPGADEDAQGEPFVGRAGRLLNAMLAAIGLAREQVYIANILKCRPPRNRDPRPEEVAACSGYLRRQIELVSPVLILAVGRVAAQNLLGVTTPIGKLRGREHGIQAFRHPKQASSRGTSLSLRIPQLLYVKK